MANQSTEHAQTLVCSILTNLKSELHVYVAAVEDISSDIEVLQWWKNHQNDLPWWSAALISVKPSSAASEQVFSLLANSFQCQQSSSLEDYIEVSLMLQYNMTLRTTCTCI